MVMDVPVYTEPHHRAAALLHQLVRVPALEFANEHFAYIVTVSYLALSGCRVMVELAKAGDLIRRVADGLDVRTAAAEIRGWTEP